MITNILQLSTQDISGGAEKIAYTLHHSYLVKGHNSWLAVGTKKSEESNILEIPNDKYRNPWAKLWLKTANPLFPIIEKNRVAWKFHRLLTQTIGQPKRWLERQLGHEELDFPASIDILNLPPQQPNILHCHNLHGEYFDLRVLPQLSKQIPTILTLHDAWLLSGHCAHSLTCDRWKTGCGQCPDLNISPAIKRDATAYNWQIKQQIYEKSKLYLATPSQWLMDKVEQSILQPAIIENKVIPNGIDLSIFHPGNKFAVRSKLSIPVNAKVILFTANTIRNNPWKDYQTMQTAINIVAECLNQEQILFIALGEDAPETQIGSAKIRFVPYQKHPETVASYYQAADVYIHAAKVDTFPNTILEALACGTPVVATAVAGIPEQIEDGGTGFLVAPGDINSLAIYIEKLLLDDVLRNQMSDRAAIVAKQKYGLERMVDEYVNWYQHILENYKYLVVERELNQN
ncbi:glycosyl transferase group 1 [Stanieria cyanosphaera PCC 7437]|uniref:Glycosyl transferase group 1 n=1 Tax=Stanieria cyanosphaera (strain ATCC 29371 / PCC 7437) TaxID=111780 RepID=K9XQ57_STAC7|nr:glycosyltransferase [Stanieria cyanosphaera]AFZ34648.1 glycosyl transferase group 1 [Stanieria cyanosphaera PCC 7437]